MHPNEHGTDEVSDRPVTFNAAKGLGGFELARQWADRMSWPWPGRETVRDHLAELAYMSALAAWLSRWLPVHIHGALLGGESLEDVVAAFGGSPDATFTLWQEWALGQREHFIAGTPGVTDDEYQAVAQRFATEGAGPLAI